MRQKSTKFGCYHIFTTKFTKLSPNVCQHRIRWQNKKSAVNVFISNKLLFKECHGLWRPPLPPSSSVRPPDPPPFLPPSLLPPSSLPSSSSPLSLRTPDPPPLLPPLPPSFLARWRKGGRKSYHGLVPINCALCFNSTAIFHEFHVLYMLCHRL